MLNNEVRLSINADVDAIIGKLFNNTLVPGLVLAESATYTHVDRGSYNSSTGSFSGGSDAAIAIMIIKGRVFNKFIKGESGSQVTLDNSYYFRPVTGVNIELYEYHNDYITYDSVNYDIKKTEQIDLGNTILLYRVETTARI